MNLRSAVSSVLVLACAWLTMGCHAPPRPPDAPTRAVDDDARAGVDHLNRVRGALSLTQVELDPVMAMKCELHARYLARNAGRTEIQGLRAHQEVAGLPGYSPEGAEAGQSSVIAFNEAMASDAIDAWLSTLYHRIPLLRRDLVRVGIGRSGTIHVLMVEVAPTRQLLAPVVFPMPAQRAVPSLFAVGEVPEPRPAGWFGTTWADATAMRSGFPITVTFDRRASLTNVRATLVDTSGAVEVAVSSPGSPATAFPQGTVVAMLPRRPLRPATTYHAAVDWMDRGAPGHLEWEFRTADAIEFSAANGTPPRAGSPVVVEGVVEYAYVHRLCESAEPGRCQARIAIELDRDDPGAVRTTLDVLDGTTDAEQVLGLVGRRVRAIGLAEYPVEHQLSIQLPNAAALDVQRDELHEIPADTIGDAQVGSFVWITGTLVVPPIPQDGPVYILIGKRGAVSLQAGAATWAALVKKLGGSAKVIATKRVRVRGKLRRGAPTARALFIAVSHPAQVEVDR